MQNITDLTSKIMQSLEPKGTAGTRPTGSGSGREIGPPTSGKHLPAAGSTIGSAVASLAATLRSGDVGYLQIQLALAASLPLLPLVRNGVEVGWQMGWGLKDGTTEADLRAAGQSLTASLSPCPEATADSELVRLSTVTKHRSPDSADLMLEEFGRRLREYPKDVVIDALRAWPQENKFFPSWNELYEELEWRVGKRRAMKVWVEKQLSSIAGSDA